MKKKKLSLKNLQVTSFVTDAASFEKDLKGGQKNFLSIGRECTQLNECPLNDTHTCGIFCKD